MPGGFVNQLRPVVVVGRNLNALGVVRSLAAGGMPIVLVSTSRFQIAALSRYCRTEVACSLGGRDLIDTLKRIRTRFALKPVLFLTEEVSVNTVSAMGSELAGSYIFSVPSQQVTELLSNKALFNEFAEREGLPIPAGRVIRTVFEIKSIRELTLPIVVKPANKHRVLNCEDEKVALTNGYEETEERCRRLVEREAHAITQEWIDGSDDEIYFCLFYADANGNAISTFTGRKVVAFPPCVGSTAICVPAPEAQEELTAITRKLCSRVRVSGLGSLEFKWDGRGRRFVIIEPTVGRSDWQEEVATLAGVNIPLIAYMHEAGSRQIARCDKPRAVAWRSSVVHRLPQNVLPPDARVYDGYWRLSDPLPGVAYYLVDSPKRRIRRLLARLRESLRRHTPAQA